MCNCVQLQCDFPVYPPPRVAPAARRRCTRRTPACCGRCGPPRRGCMTWRPWTAGWSPCARITAWQCPTWPGPGPAFPNPLPPWLRPEAAESFPGLLWRPLDIFEDTVFLKIFGLSRRPWMVAILNRFALKGRATTLFIAVHSLLCFSFFRFFRFVFWKGCADISAIKNHQNHQCRTVSFSYFHCCCPSLCLKAYFQTKAHLRCALSVPFLVHLPPKEGPSQACA